MKYLIQVAVEMKSLIQVANRKTNSALEGATEVKSAVELATEIKNYDRSRKHKKFGMEITNQIWDEITTKISQ